MTRTGEIVAEANKKICGIFWLPLRSFFFSLVSAFSFQSNIEIGKYTEPNVANMINERNGK